MKFYLPFVKKTLYFISISLFLFSNTCYAQVKSVLFIGNSYTFYNDLPSLLQTLSASKGDTITKDQSTPGGYTFNQHSTNATTLQKINQQAWDFVVLQEQSQIPAFSQGQVATDSYPFAKKLDSLITLNNPCTETIFFMTWGRKNGDASNCANYPPICTYEGMQAGLRESYLNMGDFNNATVSPVGVAWKKVREADSTIVLYNADQSHPAIAGSYLAACVFYSIMFQKPSLGAYIPSTVDSSQAILIQTIASSTVLDSLSIWYKGNLIAQKFSFANAGINSINVQDESLNVDSVCFNFGDGTEECAFNLNHQYSDTGIYIITETVYNDCYSSVSYDTVYISEPPNSIKVVNDFTIEIFPNPVNDLLEIKTYSTSSYPVILYDLLGKEIQSYIIKGNQKINVSSLNAGMYILKLSFNNKQETRLFIKS